MSTRKRDKMGDTFVLPLGDFSQQVEIAVGCKGLSVIVQTLTDVPGAEKAGLVAYEFLDANGSPVAPVPPFSHSQKVGPYFYLDAPEDDAPVATRVELAVPDEAVSCILTGHIWNPQVATYLIAEPLIRQPGSKQDSVFEEINGDLVPMSVADFTRTYNLTGEGSSIAVEAEFRPRSDKAAKALLLVEFLGVDDEQLLPTGELPINPEFGAFVYLESHGNSDISTKRVELHVPPECRQMRLSGRDWSGPAIELMRPISVAKAGTEERDSADGMVDFVQRIPDDANLIVIYTTARAIGNGSLLLRSNRLALEYADAGNWVVFFPFGSLGEDESAMPHERIYQADRRNFRSFVDAAVKRQGKHNKFICSSFSDLNVAASVDRLRDNSWTVVYEVRDDMEEFSRVGYSKWFHPLLEARVAKRADKVVAVSPRLQEKVATISGRSDVQLIPNAAPDELVKETAYLREPASIDLRKQSKTVGYIGHLTPSWFDWDLLIQVARRLPDVDFEIIGHEFPQDLSLPMNVTYLGAMPHSECIVYAQRWRAGLIPFKISPLTYGVDPNKIYEYVAMGLRTVTAPMGAVQDIPGTWVYENIDGAVEGIRDAITRDITVCELGEYDEYIRRTKWSDRAVQMLDLLEGK